MFSCVYKMVEKNVVYLGSKIIQFCLNEKIPSFATRTFAEGTSIGKR